MDVEGSGNLGINRKRGRISVLINKHFMGLSRSQRVEKKIDQLSADSGMLYYVDRGVVGNCMAEEY